MNSRLATLQSYPFEKLRGLLAGLTPSVGPPIRLSIGEPQHPTPQVVREALAAHLDGLAVYPTTAGLDRLREVLAGWFMRRYALPALDPATQVLPVNGSREALFAFAQAVVDPSAAGPVVVSPNPFYQIYEGAALLAGARPAYLNQAADRGFELVLDSLPEAEWRRTQLVYVCSPGNPTGHVLGLPQWRALFERADRYGFAIASDECYSEIYPDEDAPPLGALEAAHRLGRTDFRGLVVFTSLSKRSNAPGLRSGAVAGDAGLLGPFLRYRTYHGCAMSLPVQQASIAAWGDESHVAVNRALYRQKFAAVVERLAPVMPVQPPDAGFYLWARVPARWGGVDRPRVDDEGHRDDAAFARDVFEATHVTVLPGQFLAREAHGVNPGRGYVRIALVPGLADCLAAADRLAAFCR
ncbi:MAG: succinyldiaminopimelate transaminase [Vicinamibacterales bacterium]